MTDLIDRIEAATGADREIDAAIALHLGIVQERDGDSFYGHKDHSVIVLERDYYDIEGGAPELPRYSASIDAAMGLVKAGVPWSINYPANDDGSRSCHGIPTKPTADVCGIFGRAATPALALCAAALKARESEAA